MNDHLDTSSGRRPLKVRQVGLSHKMAKWLSDKEVTPNQISVASVLFAGMGAVCLLCLPHTSGILSLILPLGAAVFIQFRLLCNLFDGMVAVEGGKGTVSGELFNDIPDRIADPLIIVAAGYAITSVDWGGSLGWFAALLSVMTAYVRTLCVSIGAPVDFQGPMAKQHRMATLTIACLVSAVEIFLWHQSYVLLIALIVVALGCMVTLYRRTVSAYHYLEKNTP